MPKPFTPIISGLLLGSVLLQSCATLISGSRQTIRIVGQPAGSTIYVNDQPVEAKPLADGGAKVSLRRKGTSEIRIKHEGYKDYNEVLKANRVNGVTYLNYLLIPVGLVGGVVGAAAGSSNSGPSLGPLVLGLLAPLGALGVDAGTGANRRFTETEVHALMPRLPKPVANGQSVAAGPVNVRVKGGDKMGNFLVMKETKEILYFGKTLDINSETLQNTVSNTLKELGYNVPAAGRSVFSAASAARYTLQAEMRNIKYDINANSPYEALARFETSCTVEVTWKLVNQTRQTVVEQKTSGSSVKFEKGGSAAFEDAFENALYTFLDQPTTTAALANPNAPALASTGLEAANASASTGLGSTSAVKPNLAASEKMAPISVRRAAPLKPTGDNGIGAAARCVATIVTSDGHGSGCFISPDGYLVTNAHVVGNDATVDVLLADGLQAKGRVVRLNPDMDLALLKVDTDGLTAFQLPTGGVVEVGSDVFAIGTPADKELGQSIAKGIISGRRKLDGRTLLQTDVSINGGNSGGALVARSGQLLGIVNAKLVGQGIEGIGFAIPADQVSEALQLKFID
ncbi:serine protease [Hymenobacter sp. RP-2-7]|uniref:Serine protease n=1 Tax=Hymenobacter polaris TaxID=2682546 RepID=A0A7Y0AFY5_9BACT|nr:S1C family serine protease [Hymenobacter polaris]NML66648.1 serine protease [Hymenobacter polaris]